MRTFGLRYITIKDALMSLLILGITFGYFLDKYIREDITELNLLGITIDTFEFEDLVSIIYFAKMKLLIIIFSLIWYFTCRHWWKSVILVITTIELLKLVSIFKFNQTHLDKIEFLTSLPITIPIILFILFLSKKISTYNLARNLRSDLDKKINEMFFEINEEKKSEVENLKDNFIKLKMKEKVVDDEFEYLNKLIELRNNFYKI